jgi:nucleoside-diphosphate-sugar epimerase
VSTQKTRVLIAGVTGWLGHQVAAAMLQAGKADVRGLARSAAVDEVKAKRVDDLRAARMIVVNGDLADPASLAEACSGIDVVISAVQGGPEVIVEGQKRLLAAAEAAGVKRMIPSDFSIDISRLDDGDNYNIGLRKKFGELFAASRVAPTSVLCGGFLDTVLSPRFPVVDWDKAIFRYWGDGSQQIDYTAISDVAFYTAAAATDPGLTGRAFSTRGAARAERERCIPWTTPATPTSSL